MRRGVQGSGFPHFTKKSIAAATPLYFLGDKMGIFRDKDFADLSQQFNWRKGVAVKPKPRAAILFYARRSKYKLLQSRFYNPPAIKKLFAALSAKKIAAANITATANAVMEAPKRTTLKLKTKVELPPLKHALIEPEKRRHPLSNKPWSELLAEAETEKKRIWNIDLATAFKNEMRAFAAEQEKLAAVNPPVPSLKTAYQKNVKNFRPREYISLAAPARKALAA
jgi:hypothetical protein